MSEEEIYERIKKYPLGYQEKLKRLCKAYLALGRKDWKEARKWCQLTGSMHAYYAKRRLARNGFK